MAGVIDQFFIALSFRADSSGLKDFQRQAESAKDSILSIGTAVTGLLAGMAVKGIAQIGDQFEQNKIAIAGFLSALEVSPDFKTGLEDAAGVVAQITRDAARLPGEAEDYIDVFRAGLPFVQGALPGGDLKAITAFTNQLTAIGKTFQLPADQIGRELGEILSPGKGRATLRNRLFMSFLPILHKLKGQAHLTAEEFNAMTEVKRADLLQQSFARMQPMLDEAATSFDSMLGAAKSAAKQLILLGSKGLFAGMKSALAQVNALFFDADGHITAFGQNVVDTAEQVGRIAMNIVTFGTAIVKWLGRSELAGKALKGGLALLGIALAGLAFDKVTGGAGRLLSGLFNLKRLLTGGLFLALGLIAEDLFVFYRGGESVTGLLVDKFRPALALIEGGLYAIGAAFVAAKAASLLAAAGFATTWAAAFWPIFLGLAALGAVGVAIYEVWTHWKRVENFIQNHPLISAGIAIVFPLVAFIAGIVAVGKHWDDIVGYMTDKWERFIDGIKEAAAFLDGLGLLPKGAAEYIASLKGSGGKVEQLPAGGGVTAPGTDERFDQVGPVQGAWQSPYAAPAAPGQERDRRPTEGPSVEAQPSKPMGLMELLKGTAVGKFLDSAFPLPGAAGEPGTPGTPGAQGAPGAGVDLAFLKGMASGSAMTAPRTTEPSAPFGLPTTSMTGAQAGAASSVSNQTINYVTQVTGTSIEVKSDNPEHIGREIDRHLKKQGERAARNTIRTGQSRGPAF